MIERRTGNKRVGRSLTSALFALGFFFNPGIGSGQTSAMDQSGTNAPAGASGAEVPGQQQNSVYVDSSGIRRSGPEQPLPAVAAAPEQPSEFQQLAESSTGQKLGIFGTELFRSVPSTFAPGDQIAVSPDYVVGPGDDILVRMWGPEEFNSQLTVDRAGSIYIPKVGAVHVAGVQFRDLQKLITTEIGRTYRNFDLSVNMGRLRSIQVYVVGEAQRPGAYTLSSLSTVLNALFASGGPNVRGSLRHVEIRRSGAEFADFDLYDFLLRGDKSKDVRLESGDTIFIPTVGPQVAIAGSVRHPAIYELSQSRDPGQASTVQDGLELAGGLLPTATSDFVSLDRIDGGRARVTLKLALDAQGKHMPLRDGDVLFVDHITAAYDKTVTIRGNLANPGRFPWHEGMKLSDIIPDKMSLLTPGYWFERNKLGVPVPLFQPDENPSDPASVTSNVRAAAPESAQAIQALNAGTINRPTGANGVQPLTMPQQEARAPKTLITIPAAEIDWTYAVIERLDAASLRNILIPFNLGKLVQDHDPSQDQLLQPGDIVTILSQRDIAVPLALQTKYIRLEGEFASAGVYSVGSEDTLADVVRRAGGLTPGAYLYGSNFTRKSAQVFQQQRLDDYAAELSSEFQRSAAEYSLSASSVSDRIAPQQNQLIAQLHTVKASGRIVLEFKSDATGVDTIPRITLEDGDVFRVPSRPSTVSVIGAVYGQNVFLYKANLRLADYVALAGKPNRIADRKHAFVIRADGSIFSRERAQGVLSNNFDSVRINPGDAIVIPEKMIKPSIIRSLIDYSQILSSFGIAAAAVDVLK